MTTTELDVMKILARAKISLRFYTPPLIHATSSSERELDQPTTRPEPFLSPLLNEYTERMTR